MIRRGMLLLSFDEDTVLWLRCTARFPRVEFSSMVL